MLRLLVYAVTLLLAVGRAGRLDASDVDLGASDLFLGQDPDVATQEFVILKVLAGGALVGIRPDASGLLRFETGITGATYIVPAEAASVGADAWLVVRDRIALDLFGVPYAALATGTERIQTATDFNVEPPRWVVDEALLAEGYLVFQDPRGPNGVWENGGGDDVVDSAGESCAAILGTGDADPGCTPLEVISANIERLTMAGEIIGVDRFFDPPETFAEILAILDNNRLNDPFADPVAGADGIRFNDFDANSDGVVDDRVSEQGDQRAVVAGGGRLLAQSFDDCLRAGSVPELSSRATCYLSLDRTPLGPLVASDPNSPLATTTSIGRLVAANPVGVSLAYLDENGTFLGNAFFPWQELTPVEMQQLVAEDRLEFSVSRLSAETRAVLEVRFGRTLPVALLLRPPGSVGTGGFVPSGSLTTRIFSPGLGFDVDGDGVIDVDGDGDRAFDFLDDGTAGPITDDNILCATGIPGDPLQATAQLELDAQQLALLYAAFPGGLPPRSPIFCRGVTGMLDVDADTVLDLVDLCPTIHDPEQLDADGDGVGDECDNCRDVRNPRIVSPPPEMLTTSGGQRDDDADGFGNACDAKLSAGAVVSPADVNEFRASLGRRRTTATCGTGHALACARLDLDGAGFLIGVKDVTRAKRLLGSVPGPRCAACGDFGRLPCEGPACPAP